MKAQENMERGCVEQGYDDLHIKLSHAIYYVKSYSKDNTKKLKKHTQTSQTIKWREVIRENWIISNSDI